MSPEANNHSVRPTHSLLIRLDPGAADGLQQQVYVAVRGAILGGALETGARLPSSRALADDLRVSRTTTVLAYAQLIAEGYLETRRGSGTFVGLVLGFASTAPDALRRGMERLAACIDAARQPVRSKSPRAAAGRL